MAASTSGSYGMGGYYKATEPVGYIHLAPFSGLPVEFRVCEAGWKSSARPRSTYGHRRLLAADIRTLLHPV
ncbi:MAG: hypothetical protein VB858_01700 [Planctomycetaceae bacterium]